MSNAQSTAVFFAPGRIDKNVAMNANFCYDLLEAFTKFYLTLPGAKNTIKILQFALNSIPLFTFVEKNTAVVLKPQKKRKRKR